MEASKATAGHIKQVASDPQVAQVNLMRHQRTDLQPSKNRNKKVNLSSQDHKVTRGTQVSTIKSHPTKRNLILNKLTKEKIDVPSVEIQNI